MIQPTLPPSHSRGLSPFSAALLCFALAMLMHVPWIGTTHLAGTEGHRVLAARGMIENQWWLVATLYGKPFMTKPPLHYWMIAWSQLLAGRGNLFVWRLPSAIMGALFCSAVCLFGCRWFGRTAGLISGLCGVGLIALWGQCQTADIDATNTFFTAVAAFGGIELLFSAPRRVGLWIVGTGLALAGMLMTKGPGGLPLIAGVWLLGAIVAPVEHRGKDLAQPRYWLPIVIGVAIFATYSILAKRSVLTHGMPLDRRGLEEGLHRMYPGSLRQLGQSLFVMLPQVMAFALPMSAAPLFLRDPDVRVMQQGRHARIAIVLTLAVLLSWLVCVASGMVNPRYAYVTYAPLCPLAGAMAVATAASRQAHILRWTIGLVAIALAIGTCVLTFACRSAPAGVVISLGACAAFAVIIAIATIRRLAPSPIRWNASWGLVGLMLLLSIPFGMHRHLAREKDSGFAQSELIQNVVGEHAVVAAGETILWRPEIFLYTHGITAEFHPYQCFPNVVQPGRWVMLDGGEHAKWIQRPGVVLEKDQRLCRGSNGIDYFIAWYSAYIPPAPTKP